MWAYVSMSHLTTSLCQLHSTINCNCIHSGCQSIHHSQNISIRLWMARIQPSSSEIVIFSMCDFHSRTRSHSLSLNPIDSFPLARTFIENCEIKLVGKCFFFVFRCAQHTAERWQILICILNETQRRSIQQLSDDYKKGNIGIVYAYTHTWSLCPKGTQHVTYSLRIDIVSC